MARDTPDRSANAATLSPAAARASRTAAPTASTVSLVDTTVIIPTSHNPTDRMRTLSAMDMSSWGAARCPGRASHGSGMVGLGLPPEPPGAVRAVYGHDSADGRQLAYRDATQLMSVASTDREPNRWAVLALLGVAQLMVVLDATIVTIAIPSAQNGAAFLHREPAVDRHRVRAGVRQPAAAGRQAR